MYTLKAFVLYLIIKLLISPLAFSMVQIKMSSRSADITLTSPKYPLTRTLIKTLIVRKHCYNTTSQLKSIFFQLKNIICCSSYVPYDDGFADRRLRDMASLEYMVISCTQLHSD
jgi:hypothetical protein